MKAITLELEYDPKTVFISRVLDSILTSGCKIVSGKAIEVKEDLTIEFIKKTVCDYRQVPEEKLKSDIKKREVVLTRQIAMYFTHKYLKSKYTLAVIGSEIADRDHATVLHSCKTVENLMETDKKFKAQIDEIERRLK